MKTIICCALSIRKTVLIFHFKYSKKKKKIKKNLKASYITLWKPDNKKKKKTVYLEMVSQRAVNSIIQSSKKEIYLFSSIQFCKTYL